MSRLPIPGSDKGTWGDVLNDFLMQTLNADGTLKTGVVTATKLDSTTQTNLAKASTSVQVGGDLSGNPATPSVSKIQGTAVSASAPMTGQVLQFTNGSWAPGTVTQTVVSDATTSAKGIVQLAGDLGGTASAPTVPGLTAKLDATTASNTYAPKASPTFSGTVTVPTPSNNTDAATKAYVDLTTAAGAPDANATTKGKVQLAGDLSGTAAAPTVAKLGGITLPGTAPTSGQVLTASSTSATSWTTPTSAPVTSVAGRTGAITIAEADVTNLTTDLAAKATDTAVVHLAGTETVSGAKTFTGTTIVPTPTANTHAATKAYVDSAVSTGTGAGATLILNPTGVKVANYPALAQDLVLANASSGTFTVTLPTAPADSTQVEVKKLDNSANAVTIATGGSDTYSIGGTSINLLLQGQAVTFRYQTSSSKWIAISNDLPLAATDTRYAPIASPTFSGTVTVPTPVNNTDATTKTYVDTAVSSAANSISTAAVRNASATVAANTLNPFDAGSAAVTATLPTAPADKTRVIVKKIDASANLVTVATGGTDVLNKSGGGTSLTLQVGNQAITFQYATTGNIWYVINDDVPAAAISIGVTRTVTSAYTLVLSDHVVLVDPTSAAFNVTLPTAVGYFGRYTISNIAASGVNNQVTVGTTSSQTISGASTVTVGTQGSGAAYSSVDVVSNGANWLIV